MDTNGKKTTLTIQNCEQMVPLIKSNKYSIIFIGELGEC
jgi:hypothetical protein